MAGVATSIDDQIKKLKERGMVIDLEEWKVKEHLLDIGYYRLGFYWHPFEINDKHEFKEGTKLSTVIDLYYLDVDLRYLLIKYINRLELNFRTNLIYWGSMFYDKDPIWYTKPKFMSKGYIENINIIYNENFRKKNIQINKHHVKYPNDDYAPCWKTFEYYTFGGIATVYDSILNESLRKKISTQYKIKKPYILSSFLKTLVFVRNSCAHSGVIYDLKIVKGIKKIPGVVEFNDNDSYSLDAAMKVLSFLMKSVSENRRQEFENKRDKLFDKYKSNPVIKEIIETDLGYKYPVEEES